MSGKIQYSIDGEKFNLGPGDVVVINAGEFHSLAVDPSIAYHRLNLHFSASFIPKLKSVDLSNAFVNTHLYQHILPEKLVGESSILFILKKITSLCSKKIKYKDAKIIALIQELVIEINTLVDKLLSDSFHLIPPPTHTNEYIRSAIDYINSNLQKKLSVSNIANYIGLNEEYFHRLFKKTIGVSVAHYIENQKMQKALVLLKQGYPPKNVSEMLNFDYYPTFYGKFKRIFKVSPNQIFHPTLKN